MGKPVKLQFKSSRFHWRSAVATKDFSALLPIFEIIIEFDLVPTRESNPIQIRIWSFRLQIKSREQISTSFGIWFGLDSNANIVDFYYYFIILIGIEFRIKFSLELGAVFYY